VADIYTWSQDRRSSPRIDLLANLQGHVVTLDERVQVRQLSLGGMVVETTAPLSPRLTHDFRIALDEACLTVRGRVVHNRVVVQGDGVSYLAGIEFIDPSPEALEGIHTIIEQACATA
jgi:hypothetical protein